jgi:predicted transposase/invertase (TIGR01784 family)
MPKILPPYDDLVFKSILTRPEAEPARVDLLIALLGRNVKSATVLNIEPPIRDVSAKNERFDVCCIFDDGDQAAVEMQAQPMEGDSSANEHENIRDRSIYGLADLHANQSGKGIDYADICKSFQITICNYRVFDWEHRLVETFKMRNDTGRVLSEAIAAVFVDLTLVTSILKKHVDAMTAAEMWAVFLAKADEPRYTELLDQIVSRREGIYVANTMLNTISQDKRERALFHSRKMAMQDAEHNRAIVLKEGITIGFEQGFEQGRSQGIEQGISIGVHDILSKLEKLGVAPEFISHVREEEKHGNGAHQ